MIQKFLGFVRNNVFGLTLWSGIGVLLLLSAHRPAPIHALEYSSGGSGSGGSDEDLCDLADFIEDAIDDVVCGGDQGVLPAPQSQSAMRFEPNVGQAAPGYHFVTYSHRQAVLLSDTEILFQLRGSKKSDGKEIRAVLSGARSGALSRAGQPLSGRVNYLIGSDRSKWHTNIPTFGRVSFVDVYPHIDVAYHGAGGNLENDFIVQPGGDPDVIRVHYIGADALRMEADGSITIRADRRSLSWKKPVLYQVDGHGLRKRVEGRFKMTGAGEIGFEVGVYDLQRPLVIDPPLTYATFFGSASTDAAARVAADNSGNAYIIGGTDEQGFPSTPGSYVKGAGVQGNVLLAKLSSDGKSMIYETHIGGSGGDIGYGIALDATGNVYLAGMTGSADFPATSNFTSKSITDPLNCFVMELNPAGNALIYSALIGGSMADGCSSVGVDSSGNTYVVGATASSDLPVANALQPSLPGPIFGTPSIAGFAAKLNPGGTKLLYSTYYGGSGNTVPTSLAVDGSGNAYFTGFTTGGIFPTTSGAFQTTYGGTGGQTSSIFATGDAFVVKLNSSGQRVYSTYLGGSKDEIGMGIAVDSSGNAYVGGATLSANFPTKNAFQPAYAGAGGSPLASGGDGFVSELSADGSTLLFSSYIGGSSDDRVLGLALDSSNNIYLAGHTVSMNFPTAGQPAQSAYAGDNSGVFHTGDAFVSEISGAAHTIMFSTLLGGSGGDWAGGVAVDGLGGVIIAGGTSSSDFPATTGSYQPKFAGIETAMVGVPVGDAFIARFGGGVAAVSLSGISNAASYAGGAVAPGEAVLIAGSGIGPAALTGAALTASGAIATQVANTQFTFNNVPAPIVYVSQQYSSVIVPYEIAGSPTATVIATVNGQSSPPMTVKVVAALPGIFSANSSGTGPAAIRNQDGSVNSAQNPAPRGSIVTLYLTGEGQTVPPGVDGQVTTSLNIQPALSPVTVLFGSVPATSYQYAGEAPAVVAGVMQINVTIPPGAPAGAAVPLTVNLGTYSTQSGITIAIQ